MPLDEKLETLTLPAVMDIPNSEAKCMALQVSNIIHGMAFSFGNPDARSTWKPNYHFSEPHGWTSDLQETCL
jgi:hypothetical protein